MLYALGLTPYAKRRRGGKLARRDVSSSYDRRATFDGAFRLENRTGYVTADLYWIVLAILKATRTPMRGLRVVFVASPIRSRGCATVAGRRMVIAIASPANFSMRRLVRLIEHEAGHLRGIEHEKMDRKMLYSLGPIPEYAKRMKKPRYLGRAPPQLAFLRNGRGGETRRSP